MILSFGKTPPTPAKVLCSLGVSALCARHSYVCSQPHVWSLGDPIRSQPKAPGLSGQAVRRATGPHAVGCGAVGQHVPCGCGIMEARVVLELCVGEQQWLLSLLVR